MAVTLTPAHIDAEIGRLSDILESKTNEFAVLARAAAESEVAHKTARAKALLTSNGRSSDLREAEADAATEDQHLKRKIDEAVADACREAMRSLRTQLEALRTLAANLREMTR